MAKVVKKVKVQEVTLTFNEDEFALLCTLLGRIGGDPETSLRGSARSLICALREAGIEYDDYARHKEIDLELCNRGSIYFKDVR